MPAQKGRCYRQYFILTMLLYGSYKTVERDEWWARVWMTAWAKTIGVHHRLIRGDFDSLEKLGFIKILKRASRRWTVVITEPLSYEAHPAPSGFRPAPRVYRARTKPNGH